MTPAADRLRRSRLPSLISSSAQRLLDLITEAEGHDIMVRNTKAFLDELADLANEQSRITVAQRKTGRPSKDD